MVQWRKKLKWESTVNISESRSFLMGLAMLWIALHHFTMVLRLDNPVIYVYNRFILYGFFGVDIFLFLSSYGLCFSFQKDQDLGRYLSRRASRMLPTYYVWVLIHSLNLRLLMGQPYTLKDLIGNLTCTGFLFQHPFRTNWYLHSIWLFYLMFPFLFLCLVRHGNRFRTLMLLCFLSLMVLYAAQGTPAEYCYVIICRIPSFLLGIYFGIRATRKQPFPLRWELFSYALFLVTFALYDAMIRTRFDWMNETGMRWTAMIPMLPGLVAAGCRLRQLLERNLPGKQLIRITEWLGTCSLEYLMIHLLIRDDVNTLSPVHLSHFRLYQRLLLLVAAGVLSWLFHSAMSTLTSLVKKRIQ